MCIICSLLITNHAYTVYYASICGDMNACTGGAAEKCGQLQPGDKLLAINGVDVTSMSRIDAWALMKKLPEGNITLSVQR